MKKSLFCIILLIIVNFDLFSENIEDNLMDKDREWTIQTSLHYYIMDIFLLRAGASGKPDTGTLIIDLEGQYKINDLFNISLTLSFLTFFTHNDWQMHIKPMFICRPLKTGFKGFFVGVYPIIGFTCCFDALYIKEWDYEYSTDIGIGFNTGYKWIFKNGFTLQLGGGIGRTWTIPRSSTPDGRVDLWIYSSDGRFLLDYIDVNLDLKIGYSF